MDIVDLVPTQDEFEKYWFEIGNKLLKFNLNPDSTLGGFRINRMVEIITKNRFCCQELYDTIFARLVEIHNEALQYADTYGLIHMKEYPFKDTYKEYLKKYIHINF